MASGSAARRRADDARRAIAAGQEPRVDRSPDWDAPAAQHLGNQAVARLIADTTTGGATAAIHQLAATHEVGNDALARMVGSTGVQRAASAPATAGGVLDDGLAARIDAQSGGGAPLPEPIRVPMQERLGTDLGGVRVHTDATAATLARSVQAQAFTSGQDVFFGAGNYQPQSASGRELIAHEVVHVAQQRSGELGFSGRISDPADPAEVEARSLAPGLARSVDVGVVDPLSASVNASVGTEGSVAGHDVHRQPNPGTAAPDLGTTLSVPAMEDLRRVATEVSFLAGAYAERGVRAVDMLKASLVAESDTYKQAYDVYSGVIRQAAADARDEKEWIDIFVGIGIGTGVGLLSGAIIPEGLALGWSILAEAAGEGVEAVAAKAVDATGVFDVAGTDLQPGGLDPNVLATDIWHRLADLYRGVLGVQQHTQFLPLILGNVEYALGQFRLLEAGAPADMDRAALVDMAVALNRAGAHLRALRPELQQRLGAMARLEAQAAATKRRTPREVEQDIWLMWMETVPDGQSDILDRNAIEDHLAAIGVLGPGSVLGVDFGWWTSKDDELEALAAARPKAAAIRERYRALSQ
jgi:Domain of unknown function (DUF4157)